MTGRGCIWIGLCLVLVALAGCGKKGDPLPPEPAETTEEPRGGVAGAAQAS